jgi:hypothetical protein
LGTCRTRFGIEIEPTIRALGYPPHITLAKMTMPMLKNFKLSLPNSRVDLH